MRRMSEEERREAKNPPNDAIGLTRLLLLSMRMRPLIEEPPRPHRPLLVDYNGMSLRVTGRD